MHYRTPPVSALFSVAICLYSAPNGTVSAVYLRPNKWDGWIS